MSNKETLSYQLVRGALHLSDGTKIAADGTTDDAGVIKLLRELAEVKTPAGHPQYIILTGGAGQGDVNDGIVKPGEGDVKTEVTVDQATGQVDVAQHTLKYPEGVREGDIQQVEKLLTASELTFEQANALSDDDIKAKTDDIGPARIKLIRAVGAANGYAEYQPTADDKAE